MSLSLPETLNRKLPETFEEGEQFGKLVVVYHKVKNMLSIFSCREDRQEPEGGSDELAKMNDLEKASDNEEPVKTDT